MDYLKAIFSVLFFGLALLTSHISVYSQQPSGAVHVASTGVGGQGLMLADTRPALALRDAGHSDETVDELNFGNVSGRVSYDPEPAGLVGIGGVLIKVRRIDAGFANFFFERISQADGTFEFQTLRPGRYTIEIDRASLPAKFAGAERQVLIVDVAAGRRSFFDLKVKPQRIVTGIVFVDENGDGKYKRGEDTPVEGAYVTAGGNFALTDANGSYVLRDLPAGRVGMLVTSPKKNGNTHVVLDLGAGPVTNRVVDVPLEH